MNTSRQTWRYWGMRVLPWAKWIALALTVLTLALSTYSLHEPISAINGDNIYSIERGQFQVIYRPDEPQSFVITLWHGVPAFTGMSLRRIPAWGFDQSEHVAWLELPPFWLGAIPGLPALLLWWCGRARTRLGECPRCNYSLAGLSASTPCPECGTAR